MNPSLPHDLQFLNYLEIFGHRHGAAALRKAMHLPSELAPEGEAQDKLAQEAFNEVAQALEGDNAGLEDRPEWPDIIGSGGEREEETHGTKLAAELRAACNGMTEQERDEALAYGMRIIYGENPDHQYERVSAGIWIWMRRKQPTQHHFIKSDGTPIYPLPKKPVRYTPDEHDWICIGLGVILIACGFTGLYLVSEVNAYSVSFGILIIYQGCCIYEWLTGTRNEPLFLKPRQIALTKQLVSKGELREITP